MKKGFIQGIIGMLSLLLFTQGALATTAEPDQAHPSGKWQLLHNEDGSSEFAIQHGSVRHFYRLKLLALKVGEHTTELTAPKITKNQHYLTKQWLPYLTESWFQTANGWQWVATVDHPDLVSSQADDVVLSYQVESDSRGGLTVSGHSRFPFDHDFEGQVLHPMTQDERDDLGEPSLSHDSYGCHLAQSVQPNPARINQHSFNLQSNSFPLHLQGRFSTHIRKSDSVYPASNFWYEADMQPSEQGMQLMLPASQYINGEEVEFILMKRLSGLEKPDDVVIKTEVIHQPDERSDLVMVGRSWHPIKAHDLHQTVRTFRDNHPKQFKAAIKSALSKVSGLSRQIHLGMAITLAKDQMMVVSRSRSQEVHVFNFKNNQWHPQQVIELPDFLNFDDGSQADLEALSPVVHGDVMVVPMDQFGGTDSDHSMGAVWVYRKIRNRWQHEDMLTPDVGDWQDLFGVNVAVGRDQIIVSASQYGEDSHDDSLPGLVHVFKYRGGTWRLAQTLKPGRDSQVISGGRHEGFGSQFKLVGDDLYILAKDEGFSSVPGISQSCPYFDSSGVVYHYQHFRGQWRFKQTIKTTGHPGHVMLMTADERGLYVLVSEYLPKSGTHQMAFYRHKGEQLRKLTAWATDHD